MCGIVYRAAFFSQKPILHDTFILKSLFFLSGELLILTKNEEHLGFSFVVLIRKNGVEIPITGPAHCSHEQRKHHGRFTPGSIHAGPFVMRTFPQWSDFSESSSVVSDSS